MQPSLMISQQGYAATTYTLGLIDIQQQPEFEALTRMAARLLDVPVALVSVVEEGRDRQFFVGQKGLSEPWATTCQTPLSHSFCQYVKAENAPLIVADAREHPMVKDNPAVDALNVVAYLGVPILLPGAEPIGALCVIEHEPRDWTANDLEIMMDLARCVNSEILLRAAILENRRSAERERRHNEMRDSIAKAFMSPGNSFEIRFQDLLAASCKAFDMRAGRIVRFDCGLTETLHAHDPENQFATHAAQSNLEVLTRTVMSECTHICIPDLSLPNKLLRFDGAGRGRGEYAGTPLIFNNRLYGAIEFVNDTPRSEGWSASETSILSVVASFVTTNLSVAGQIEMLQKSEQSLLSALYQKGELV